MDPILKAINSLGHFQIFTLYHFTPKMKILAVAGFISVLPAVLGAIPSYTELEILKPNEKAALQKVENLV